MFFVLYLWCCWLIQFWSFIPKEIWSFWVLLDKIKLFPLSFGQSDGLQAYSTYQRIRAWGKKIKRNLTWYTLHQDSSTLCVKHKNAQVHLLLLKESLLNYVECGKILVWKQLEHFQVGFLVITILIGIGLFFVAYKTNQLDVSL